ncbi:XRE family transcriptional regulator [Rhizobiaceae bacterium BDR2-2]|uniref:XRE family transcriptional regulator n=1 Tax=Ectorhizobium quercum TaxID=2965071 RepID=A0AAE3SVM0_9HYPH|nr:XRE family transcriptional regulator [Ectorhizobium quercum]MCX8998495.1 XRE family transcriptional regulator [Ectorhizobium quercum]
MSTLSDNLDRCLGDRIRIEREARNWSLTDLSERAGVSRAMIHKVERGESSPTAALLGRLCGAFSLSVSTLMARAEGGGGRVSRAAGRPVWVDPETGYRRTEISPATDIPLDIVSVELPAGARVAYGADNFTFVRQMIWVLDGELTFTEGAAVHRLAAGDCLALGPPADCVFDNRGDTACRYAVLVVKPA